MQIQGPLGPNPSRPGQAATPRAQAQGPSPVDRFVAGGDDLVDAESLFLSNRKPELDSPAVLPEEAAPRLQRPVLFVHGYMGKAEEFSDMMTWLSRDGENRSGGFLEGKNPGPVDPEANCFSLRLTKGFQSMETNAGEIHDAVEAICQATGATDVDVVCHSKGGLDTRQYLMDPEEKVDHVVLIGTPNKGTYLANLELVARENFGHPVNPPTLDPEASATLKELTVDRVDRNGVALNPKLHHLNAGWDTQRGRAEFLAIDGNGVPTLNGSLAPTFLGDGTVPRKSAVPPETPARHMWFRRHGLLPRDAQVMREVAAFLTGRPTVGEEDIFTAPGAREAALALDTEGYLADQGPGR